MITNESFRNVLKHINFLSRNKLKDRGQKTKYGSERMFIIRNEIPYNPLQIMREASRIAVEAGLKDCEMWSLDNNEACVGNKADTYATSFISLRRQGVDPSDADKLAALEVLANVCEYINKKENKPSEGC